jgi:hypothetical protein
VYPKEGVSSTVKSLRIFSINGKEKGKRTRAKLTPKLPSEKRNNREEN